MEAFGKILLVFGVSITLVGGLLLLLSRLGLGRLPGDLYIQRGNFVFYFPLMTGLLISIILTLFFSIFWR